MPKSKVTEDVFVPDDAESRARAHYFALGRDLYGSGLSRSRRRQIKDERARLREIHGPAIRQVDASNRLDQRLGRYITVQKPVSPQVAMTPQSGSVVVLLLDSDGEVQERLDWPVRESLSRLELWMPTRGSARSRLSAEGRVRVADGLRALAAKIER